MNRTRGILLMIFATVCWGLMSPIAKIIGREGTTMVTLTTCRAGIASCILLCAILVRHRHDLLHPSRTNLTFYALTGLFNVALTGTSFMLSLNYLTVAQALIINYTYPMFTMLVGFLIMHERPTNWQVIAGFMIIAGVFVGMGASPAALMGVSLIGVLLDAVATASFTSLTVMTRWFSARHKVDELAVLFFSNVVGFLLLASFKTATEGWANMAAVTPKAAALIMFEATVGSAMSYAAFYAALKYIPAGMASLFCPLELVAGVVFSAVFVAEIPSSVEIMGCGILIVAMLITAIPQKK